LVISVTSLFDRSHPSRRLAVALAASIAVVLVVGGVVISRSWLFDIRTVDVTGASHLTTATVEELAAIADGTSVWWLDEAAAEARLERHTWIADAVVSASFPRSLSIHIREREPVAVLASPMRPSLLADDGTVLGAASAEDAELPDIVAVGSSEDAVAGAAEVVASMPRRLAARLDRVEILPVGGLELVLDGDVLVRYGHATDQDAKASTILRLLAWSGAQGRAVATLNVMAPGVPTLTYHD
jgi:cell division protein FtsQ